MNTGEKFFLRKDFKENITNIPLISFLRKHNIQFTEIREEMFEKLEESIEKGQITNKDLNVFLENETRYGHNRTIFCYEIASEDLIFIENLDIVKLGNLLKSKGWVLPTQTLIDFYLPTGLTLAEYFISESKVVNLTFVETINIETSKIVKKDNNFYFVTIDPRNKEFAVRMRPRSNAVRISGGYSVGKIKDVQLFYDIKSEMEKMFNVTFITSSHFKTTLYKIARDMTEKAEEKWRLEVNKYEDEIIEFSNKMESKLEGIDPKKFDLKFRFKRLLERALIKSNFLELKVNSPGKKGYINMFHFSDNSGGKIKASSKEKEKAIELSEIYYDTRDTIDKSKAYDTLWVHWFREKKVLRTKLESTSEYYHIHFFKYISEDDMSYVLSEVRDYQKT